MEDAKLTNPKHVIGSNKVPLHLWPATATAEGAIGLLDGMLKYGYVNWRASGVRATTYASAVKRHIDAWLEGQDNSPDNGVSHLGHALACLAILVDARAAGVLNDDRPYPGGYEKLMEELTPTVAHLRELYEDRDPHHWTRADIKPPVVVEFFGSIESVKFSHDVPPQVMCQACKGEGRVYPWNLPGSCQICHGIGTVPASKDGGNEDGS